MHGACLNVRYVCGLWLLFTAVHLGPIVAPWLPDVLRSKMLSPRPSAYAGANNRRPTPWLLR